VHRRSPRDPGRARAGAGVDHARVAGGDFELAEEAVQEAFAAATAAWADGAPAEPRGWLVQVARNKAIDTIRRRVKLRAIVATEPRPGRRPRADARPRWPTIACASCSPAATRRWRSRPRSR
jgi:DNA-directed RNA polymerase specialized sigma24 family protein